mgnify:CR=1 FL=1
MGNINNMAGIGFEVEAAKSIVGTIEAAATAAGSTAANAYALKADATLFTTVGSGTGAKLPATAPVGSELRVYNGGANALLVYPPTSGQINNQTATTGTVSIAAGKGALFARLTNIHWGCVRD